MMKRFFTALPVLLLPLAAMGQSADRHFSAADSVRAQKDSLEDVVITGLPQGVRLQNALTTYRILDKKALDAMGAVNLADALSTQLNIALGNDALLGANVSLQGLGGNKVKILIDGLPVNGRENGNIDLGQLNLANIERVEIVQGPMSIVYGSDALGGVINLITAKKVIPWNATATLNYESAGKYNADVTGTHSWRKGSLTLGAGRHYFEGWKDLDAATSLPHRRLLWKPKEQYFGNAAFSTKLGSNMRLQLASDFVKEKVTNKGLASVTPYAGYAFDEYYHTTRSLNRALLSGSKGSRRWEFANSYDLYYRTKERLRKDLVTLGEIPTQGTGDQDTTTFHDVTLRSNYSDTLRKFSYDGGYDVALQWGRSGKIASGKQQQQDYALYANAQYELAKNLSLKAGLRGDYNDHYGMPFVYSLQALYKPSASIAARLSYARGFRAPSLKEQYLEFIDQNHHILGNPDLKAEDGDHIQGSLSWQALRKRTASLRLLATGFYNNVHNEITLAAVHPEDSTSIDYTYANLTHIRNAIGNLQAEWSWRALSGTAGYGLTHTFEQAGAYQAFDVSEITATAQYYWRRPQLRISVFYKWTGAQPALSSVFEGSASFNGRLPDYQLLDASAERKFYNNRIGIIAGVKNIFDVQQILAAGATSGGVHNADGSANFLPRRVFVTLRLMLNGEK